MIISRTPFRISFFGGGTDYPNWYLRNGGKVISTTFDKFCYVSCRELPPFFDHKYRVTYSKVEDVSNIEDIEHPAVRAVVNEANIPYGLEIHCDADLPARSGLGSSSSFVVGLINAVEALRGRRVSKELLFKEAIRVEQNILAENVGSQDQAAAAFGGLNVYKFERDGSIVVEPVILPPQRKKMFNEHLMLFFTGFSRIASQVAKAQIDNIPRNSEQLVKMISMVDNARDILCSSADVRELGDLLHQAWMLKRSLADNISTLHIDSIYERARMAGAIGGKLLGAGGGGFILLFVEPHRQASVRTALHDFIHIPMQFETAGSQVIYYAP
jgi:D-glycero-alpha-D-manno-heptose-7-phosphate kinase